MQDSEHQAPKTISALPRQAPRMADREAGRANNFNLIRMIAASGVLVSHAFPISLGPQATEPLQPYLKGISLGTLGVYAFFAISGFFITRSLGRSSLARSSLGRRSAVMPFLKARALRLVPALAVALALTVLVLGPAVTQAPLGVYWSGVPGYYLHNMTLFFPRYDLPGVFPDNPYGAPINGSLWTLSYEVLCYFSVLVCGVLGVLRYPKAFLPLLVVFCVFYAGSMMFDLPFRLEELAKLALPFVVGMSFWIWRDKMPLSLPLGGVLALIAGLAWLTPVFQPFLVLALSYGVFVLGFAHIPGLAAYARLGDYSYGLYVYAFPVQQVIAFAGVTNPLVNVLLAFPMTLVCAILSWHLIEAPALRLRRTESTAAAAAR